MAFIVLVDLSVFDRGLFGLVVAQMRPPQDEVADLPVLSAKENKRKGFDESAVATEGSF